ncbi:MAG: molybdate ABC transporter periplasmic molybdate-binding protein [Methanoregula sp. PtaU1.Bin006]|uniref:molybdate ABC transporter substrate-binding protein n=1 Tax=Methanoregula sp. PtaU1.Bin006 TaxID=1811681 RepID=UPI0009C82615|nr:molybdate ABC transporter substrate-binding protein [Methanoregula sp. PtaU1.Bin006]OPY32875.1 MAG: molybdate ABC transporter periplasmic molybdate-binding protein [Methanoregula sp. PtaU1.Bin006]
MNERASNTLIIKGLICGILLAAVLFSGCTGNSPQQAAPLTTVAAPPYAAPESASPAATTTTSGPAAAAIPSTPAPAYTSAEGTVIAYTAASLKGASPALASGYAKMYPGRSVVFNLDGTQALKTQVLNGAYADVFISASNTYTAELSKGGYFTEGTVKTLTTNYVIVILPAANPAKIQSLNDLAKPGVKIARGAKSVPVGTATDTVINNLAKTTYGTDWNNAVNTNTVTYETSEPAVATKVALGEADAGFVYESTATAAKPGTYTTLTIPKKDNFLQVYSIAVMKESKSTGAARDFETFMLSDAGQQILKDYGFRPA